MPGFDKRIESELRMINPIGTQINVFRAFDEKLDAWRGAALLALTYFNRDSLKDYCFSKQ